MVGKCHENNVPMYKYLFAKIFYLIFFSLKCQCPSPTEGHAENLTGAVPPAHGSKNHGVFDVLFLLYQTIMTHFNKSGEPVSICVVKVELS